MNCGFLGCKEGINGYELLYIKESMSWFHKEKENGCLSVSLLHRTVLSQTRVSTVLELGKETGQT